MDAYLNHLLHRAMKVKGREEVRENSKAGCGCNQNLGKMRLPEGGSLKGKTEGEQRGGRKAFQKEWIVRERIREKYQEMHEKTIANNERMKAK